jgi:hypothetical protein
MRRANSKCVPISPDLYNSSGPINVFTIQETNQKSSNNEYTKKQIFLNKNNSRLSRQRTLNKGAGIITIVDSFFSARLQKIDCIPGRHLYFGGK